MRLLPSPHPLPVLLAAALLPLLLSCSSNSLSPAVTTGGGGTSSTTAAPQWVVAWGNSPEGGAPTAANPGGTEQSFRFFFVPTVAGTQERVRFTNHFGTAPITISGARLAVAAGGATAGSTPAIDPTHDAALAFSGNPSVTIPAGQEVVSDPVSITYTFGQKMAVSLYLSGSFPSLTEHDSQGTVNFATPSGAGNTTADAPGASFSEPNTEWFLVRNLEVFGPYQGTVALFGSSSIDGHASNFGDTNAYPVPNVPIPGQDADRPSDWLARQLNAAGYNLGVLNAGILGDPAGPSSTGTGSVPGVDRLQPDVLAQPAVKAVVIYLGGVDIRGTDCRSAPFVESALAQMTAAAHAAGVRVVLATLPPGEWCSTPGQANFGPIPTDSDPFAGDLNPGPENPGSTQRRLLNDWIRTTGATLPGVVSVADFDKVLASPAHPDFMIPNLNSGDNFHPNGTGYGVQSGAISLPSLLGP